MTDHLAAQLTQMLNGLMLSILVSALGIVAGIIIGCVAGALRHAEIPVVRHLIAIYVNFFRSTPLIVQIFFLYAALPELGIKLTSFQVGFIALAIWGGAYQTEAFRAAFKSVPRDEITAARALGIPAFRTFLDVTLPLGLRTALPAMTTVAITQFRSSSFLVAVGFAELTFVANQIVSETFEVFKIFGIAALMYLVVCLLMSYGGRQLERKMAIPGLGVKR